MAHPLIGASTAPFLLPQLRWTSRQILVTLGLLALLVWALASLADSTRLVGTAHGLQARPELLAFFLATYAAAFALRAWAWRLLLPGGPGLARLFTILQVALLANHLFPTKAGELIRAGLLARAGAPLGAAAGSTALARLLDFAALGLIALALSPLAGGQLQSLLALLALPLAGAGLGICGCLLLASGRLSPLWSRLPPPLKPVAQQMEASLAATPFTRQLAAFAIVVPSWLLEAGALWVVAQAAGVPLSFEVAAAATAITIAFQAFQVTPGGIGLYEASLTAALALYGIDPATGLSLAVVTHALKFAYAYAAGIPCLVAEGFSVQWGVGAIGRWGEKLEALGRQIALELAGWLSALPWLLGLALLLPIVLPYQWWLARRPLAPPRQPPPGSSLAVVIPVHNEAATIGSVVAAVPREQLKQLGFETRVVVVDDGSTDGSGAMAQVAGADLVVRHAERRGLGAALRSGLIAAYRGGAGAAVYLDGDGEYDPRDIPAVAGPVLRGEADYVLGSRFPAAARMMRPSRHWGNRAFTALLSLLAGRRLSDGQTGFRAFSARALGTAEIIHDYNYAQVLTLNLLRKRMRLTEVPIAYRLRQNGRSFIRYGEYLRRVLPAMAREVLEL